MSSTAGDPVENLIAKNLIEKIISAHRQKINFKIIIAMPLLPV